MMIFLVDGQRISLIEITVRNKLNLLLAGDCLTLNRETLCCFGSVPHFFNSTTVPKTTLLMS